MIKQVKDRHFKYFKETKSFENGFYVLKIKFELQEDSELHNKVIIRYFSDTQTKYKKMHLLEESEGPRWTDSNGFRVDESYFEKRSFVLDTRKSELIYKNQYEGSIDEYWDRIVNDVRFWQCVDTPFELKESA